MRLSHALRSESGSAFILVLLALLILTFLGLSLTLVTETEMTLGGTERVINKTFYGAETGVQAALAQVLTSKAYNFVRVTMPEGPLGAGRTIGLRATTTAVHTVGGEDFAPLTTANEGEGSDYKTYMLTVTSTGERLSWPDRFPVPACIGSTSGMVSAAGDEVTVQAQQVISTRVLVSPFKRPSVFEMMSEGDTAAGVTTALDENHTVMVEDVSSGPDCEGYQRGTGTAIVGS